MAKVKIYCDFLEGVIELEVKDMEELGKKLAELRRQHVERNS